MEADKFKGTLELNWINKDKSLLYEIDEEEGRGIKPIWVDKNDIRVSEPRNLKLIEEYGEPNNQNILIKGDNLLALRSLVEMFKNREETDKVKCIYIDPPFNSGNAFDDYEDNLEHSQWLTMIRDRLILLKKLLREDGVIFVHCDETEMAYLRIILDEIFGRKNFMSLITWERSQRTVLGQGSSTLNDTAEYILFYSKNKELSKSKLKKLKKKYLIEENTYKQYHQILDLPREYRLHLQKADEFIDSKGNPVITYLIPEFKILNISLNNFEERIDEINDQLLKNYDKVIRLSNQQKESSFQQKLISNFKNKQLYLIKYTPSRGKRKEKEIELYYYGKDVVLFLKDYTNKEKNIIYKIDDLNNIWSKQEIPITGIANEGNVKFKRSKKPERLIKRLLDISTDENDLVLDSFLGSGTTAAVAHKMKRRWIGIELGKHAETHCIPRIKSVISGEDQTGISKIINWKGGSGFRYYIVGESVLREENMNWNLTYEEIAKSLFMMFDYIYEGVALNEIYIGKNKNKLALSMTSKDLEIIRLDEYNDIISVLNKKYSDISEINIYTNKGIGLKNQDLPKGVSINKIPESILHKFKL